MKKITIDLPQLGKQEGTLTWVCEKLEELAASLRIHPERMEVIAGNRAIAFIPNENDYFKYAESYDSDGVVLHLFPTESQTGAGLFNAKLTPAAYAKTEEFIQSAVDQLTERFENS